jgi:hypothetical protein
VRPVCTRSTPGIIRNDCAARLTCARSAELLGWFNQIRTTRVTVGETGGVVRQAPGRMDEQIASVANASSQIRFVFLSRLIGVSCRSLEQIPIFANLFAGPATDEKSQTAIDHSSAQTWPNDVFFSQPISSE